MLILMLLNLNTGYADTDADLCIRIMSLCCIRLSDYRAGGLVMGLCFHCRREVLVNRGWVPVAWENPEIRKEGQITGNIKIYGMIRTKERVNKHIHQ